MGFTSRNHSRFSQLKPKKDLLRALVEGGKYNHLKHIKSILRNKDLFSKKKTLLYPIQNFIFHRGNFNYQTPALSTFSVSPKWGINWKTLVEVTTQAKSTKRLRFYHKIIEHLASPHILPPHHQDSSTIMVDYYWKSYIVHILFKEEFLRKPKVNERE